MVVAPKPSGDIRLCVDMRRANEAIVREGLPIPTVDEVLESLNGSTVFSKLDLRWGFHQIELEPNSRDITAFATDDGIFRYKRLSFGVNAAPEKYQHIIAQTMAGFRGVANIAGLSYCAWTGYAGSRQEPDEGVGEARGEKFDPEC